MNLKILDVGYVANLPIGIRTQLARADRAGYTGTDVVAFTLDTRPAALSGSVGIEDKPVINTKKDSSTSLVSTKNRQIHIDFTFAKTIVTSGFDENNIIQFLRLERTDGLKILYPSNTTDVKKHIVEALGAVNIPNGNFVDATPTDNEGTVSSTTPHLIGRVKNINITDGPGTNLWKGSFDFQISE